MTEVVDSPEHTQCLAYEDIIILQRGIGFPRCSRSSLEMTCVVCVKPN